MDAYEATRVVFSRIQSLDPENAAKVMGFLLIQDRGDKEMTRLAFGPESLLNSVVAKARSELRLQPPAAGAAPIPSPLGRQGSSARLLGGGAPLSASLPASWPPPSGFSGGSVGSAADELLASDELVSQSNLAASPFYSGGGDGVDLVDELQLYDQFSFLDDGGAAPAYGLPLGPQRDFLYQVVDGNCRSPSSNGENAAHFPHSGGWGAVAGHHRRSCSAADVYLSSDAAGVGWKPCLYFARGYCKNGSSCRFLHGFPDDSAAAVASGNKMDAAIEQQCQEILLRSKSPRQLMPSAFPYTPAGSVPASPSGANKGMDFLLQLQNENQRAMAAAAAAALILGGDEGQKFMGRPWMMTERSEFGAGMANPGSRQIYLTFPADSTFREEDVSNYFSIYGPVQDVRIPYQQKRMFGFVTFVYPETVKLILSKGNPHFVCNARVLVKPYKEKGRVPDKKQQPPPQAERVDFAACTTAGLDSRDPFDFTQLGPRMPYNGGGGGISQEALLRKLEEQQQAAELHQAIELQNRRFMGLHLLDIKNRNHFNLSISIPQEESKPEDENLYPVTAEPLQKLAREPAANAGDAADKAESRAAEENSKEDTAIQRSAMEHNLPDSPFSGGDDAFFPSLTAEENLLDGGKSSGLISSQGLFPAAADVSSFNGCFFQLPRLSSDHGAVGM